jgi:hypothetical protein
MPYDMPMSLEEVLADEQARRAAAAYLEGANAPLPSAAPQMPAPQAAQVAPDNFAALAQRYTEAQQRDAQQRRENTLSQGFGNAAETALGAAGVRYARGPAPREPDEAGGVLRDARAQAEIAKLGRPTGTAPGKAAPNNDPNSPDSKTLQDAVRARYPGVSEEELRAITPANFKEWRISLDAKSGDKTRRDLSGATLGEQQARRRQDADQFAKRYGLDLDKFDQDKQEFLAELAAKEREAADKKAAKEAEVSVPGLEVVPGETPTPKDAETLKSIMSANGELKRSVKDLRALHQKYGTEMGGKGGVPMRQTMTAIKLAAKTIADLGALSGPDQGLMEDLAGGDPTTIEASAKAFFGVDNTADAMAQLERWAENRISAALEARGYRVRTTPKRVPAANVLPKGADGQPPLDGGKVRVRQKSTGRVKELDAATAAKVLAKPDYEKVQ